MERTSLHEFDNKLGYESVINKESSKLIHLGFSTINVDANNTFVFEPKGEEMALVLQKGDFVANVVYKGETVLDKVSGTRQCCFEERPTTIYLPPNAKIAIETKEGAEFRIFTAPCEEGNSPYFCPPTDIEEGEPGAQLWKRKYRFIFGPSGKHNGEITKQLIVGESVSIEGGWIGFPGHRHDFEVAGEEHPLEEIFSIRVKGPDNGPGTVINYSTDVVDGKRWNEFFVLEQDNNAIALPEGFHTSFAAPGCKEYLLWGLAGAEKIYKVKFDERYTNLENALY